MNQTTVHTGIKKKAVALLACAALAASCTFSALAYGPVVEWKNTVIPSTSGLAGSGTSGSPYLVELSDTSGTKISWKAFESYYTTYSTTYWEGAAAGTGAVDTGNYSPSYLWNFYSGDMSDYVAQPYYTDIALLDTDSASGYDRLSFACATKFPGPMNVSVKVSDIFPNASSVTVTYRSGSCDGVVQHATDGPGDYLGQEVEGDESYLEDYDHTFTTGIYPVDANGYITIPSLYHGGEFNISAS